MLLCKSTANVPVSAIFYFQQNFSIIYLYFAKFNFVKKIWIPYKIWDETQWFCNLRKKIEEMRKKNNMS